MKENSEVEEGKAIDPDIDLSYIVRVPSIIEFLIKI